MKRILLDDDDPSILEGLERTPPGRRHEWNTASAGSGRAALEAPSAARYASSYPTCGQGHSFSALRPASKARCGSGPLRGLSVGSCGGTLSRALEHAAERTFPRQGKFLLHELSKSPRLKPLQGNSEHQFGKDDRWMNLDGDVATGLGLHTVEDVELLFWLTRDASLRVVVGQSSPPAASDVPVQRWSG